MATWTCLSMRKMGAGLDVLVDPDLEWNTPTVTLLRGRLMKPGHLAEVPRPHDRVFALAAGA